MPAISYLSDGAALWRRIGAFFTGVGGLLFFAGMILFNDDRLEPTTSGVAFVLLVLVVTGAEVFVALNVRQGATDGLRLDGGGLTKISGRREVFWAWNELSRFRLHSRFHPASLLLGQCVSFRVEDAGRRSPVLSLVNRILFFGGTNVLGRNYFVLPKELVERLNEYSGATSPVSPSAEPAPALFFETSALNGRRRLRLLFLIASSLLLAIGVVALVLLFAEHAWPDALDMLVDSGLAFYMALPVILIPAFLVVQVLWATSPVLNLLLASAGGLHVRKGQYDRHWTWDEIFESGLNRYPTRIAAKRTEWTVALTAAHRGVRPGRPPKDNEPPPAVIFSLEDRYNVPLAEIAGNLNDWLDRHGMPDRQRSGVSRRRIRYHSSGKQPSDALWSSMLGAIFAGTAASFLLLILATIFLKEHLPEHAVLLLLLPWFVIGLVQFTAVPALAAESWNYLELDAEGLTWRRVGLRRRWTWQELPSFELRIVTLRWKRKPAAVIMFNGHDDDRLSRFLRWAYRIDEALPRIVIEDIYDSPIQEVLARLKAYRRPPGFGHAPHRGHVPEYTELEAL